MHRQIICLTILISFVFAQASLHSQNRGPFQNELKQAFLNEDLIYSANNDHDYLTIWQERILLHLDKEIINEDSPLFFKAYLFTGPNRVRATLSNVLKLELLNENEEIVATQYHKIVDGMADGVFTAPKRLAKGSYTLRAYTRWMQNYGESYYYSTILNSGSFADKTTLVDEEALLSVKFYPEGGNLVDNLNNWLLIKATNKDGKRLSINGDIVDENNTIITTVKSYGEGVSSVNFSPITGKQYKLRTENGRLYTLPETLPKGFLINVNNLNPDNLTLRIQSTTELSNSKVWIRGKMSDVLYFNKEIQLKTSSTIIEVPKEGIPFGILTIELVNENGVQFAQRPVPIEIKDKLNISLNTINNSNDGKISYKVKVTDLKGMPVETPFSFSAVGLSSIGLGKEVKNGIEGKNFQVRDLKNSSNNEREVRYKTDISVLTYNQNNQLLSQDIPDAITYPFQKGLNLYGYVYNLNNELLANTIIQIYGVSEKDMVVKEIITNNNGVLRLEDLQFEGETELVFRTTGVDTKNRLVKFIPMEEKGQNVEKSSSENRVVGYQVKKGEVVQSSSWEPIDEDRLIVLEEVSVMDKKIESKKSTPSVYGVDPSRVVYQDEERPKTIPELFLGIPGVQVVGLGTFYPNVSLPKAAGLGPVLWVLDGMPLSQESISFGGSTGLAEIMSSVAAMDVERIEILFGAQASIYGSRASGGAIVIYTRSGSTLSSINRKDAFIKFQGYCQSPNFESYQKEINKKSKKSKNEILTLFWDSSLSTDEKGEAIINFDLPDKVSILELKVKVVTKNGEIGELRIL